MYCETLLQMHRAGDEQGRGDDHRGAGSGLERHERRRRPGDHVARERQRQRRRQRGGAGQRKAPKEWRRRRRQT